MQHTIRLSGDDYRLTDQNEVVMWIEPDYAWRKTKYQRGRRAVLVSTTDVSPNAIRDGRNVPVFYLHWDLTGVAGNSNPKIKCTDGWRGTTDDRSCDAHGIVVIRTIKKLKNGDLSVMVSD